MLIIRRPRRRCDAMMVKKMRPDSGSRAASLATILRTKEDVDVHKYTFSFSACRFYSRHQDWLLIVASYSLSLTGWLGGRRRASANASISLLVDHRTVDRTCGSVANSETGDFARMFLCICRWRRRRTLPNSLVGCRFRSQFREREWDEDVHSLSEEFIETGSSIYFPFLVFSWRWS